MASQGAHDEPPGSLHGANAAASVGESHASNTPRKPASSGRTELLRQRAIAADQKRSPLRRDGAQEALKIWQALVEGRWSLVDWFDTDERRYILARPNPTRTRDPRALTKRESQIAGYAALGESHKMIAYRLGIARSTVTNTLHSAMRKLGVSTQAQLVQKLRGMELPGKKHAANDS